MRNKVACCFAAVILCAVLLLFAKPKDCALCDAAQTPRFGPCVINPETGEIGELNPSFIQPAEEIEDGSYMYYFSCTGTWVMGDMNTRTCELPLPDTRPETNAAHFCRDCRARLAETAADGYILADLYDRESIQTYAVTDGAKHNIRGYAVAVSKEKNAFTITVTQDFS